jgi:hypothetical protein
MELLVIISVVALVIGALAAWSVACVYMYLHRGWRKNIFAKLLIPSLLAKGTLFTWLAVARLLPRGQYIGYISTGLFIALVVVMVYRAVVYFQEEIKLYKELKNATVD